MSICECGHGARLHRQADEFRICTECSCDRYRKAADFSTADLPAGGTPEGLAPATLEDHWPGSQEMDIDQLQSDGGQK